ncbi:hypothetical protein ACWIB8_03700 [Corynebacterium flavescens]
MRHGRPEIIDTYFEQGCIHGGEEDALIDAAYNTWRTDIQNDRVSVLIAESVKTVTTLNNRARADLILDGALRPSQEVELNDGTLAGVGDTVITRRNDRRLCSSGTWARNGDRWNITKVRDVGSITIRAANRRFGSATTFRILWIWDMQ